MSESAATSAVAAKRCAMKVCNAGDEMGIGDDCAFGCALLRARLVGLGEMGVLAAGVSGGWASSLFGIVAGLRLRLVGCGVWCLVARGADENGARRVRKRHCWQQWHSVQLDLGPRETVPSTSSGRASRACTGRPRIYLNYCILRRAGCQGVFGASLRDELFGSHEEMLQSDRTTGAHTIEIELRCQHRQRDSFAPARRRRCCQRAAQLRVQTPCLRRRG